MRPLWISRRRKRTAAAVSVIEAIGNLTVQATLRFAYSQPTRLPKVAASSAPAEHEPPQGDTREEGVGAQTFRQEAWASAFSFGARVIIDCHFAATRANERVKIYVYGRGKMLKVLRQILEDRATGAGFEVTDHSMSFYYIGIVPPSN